MLPKQNHQAQKAEAGTKKVYVYLCRWEGYGKISNTNTNTNANTNRMQWMKDWSAVVGIEFVLLLGQDRFTPTSAEPQLADYPAMFFIFFR